MSNDNDHCTPTDLRASNQGDTHSVSQALSVDQSRSEVESAPSSTAEAPTDGSSSVTPCTPPANGSSGAASTPRRRIPKLAIIETDGLFPQLSLAKVLDELRVINGGADRVLIGSWSELYFRSATYLITTPELLTQAKGIRQGSRGAIERQLRTGQPLSRHHLIQGGRVVRHLPDLRLGAPVQAAQNIVVLQPQEHDPQQLAAFVRRIASPGAKLTLIGYEPFVVSTEVDAVVHKFHRALTRLNTPGQGGFYKRFRTFPLDLKDDPSFDVSKKRFGEVTWQLQHVSAYFASLPSWRRLVTAGGKRADDLRLPFDELRELAKLDGLKKAWGGPSKKRLAVFPLAVRSGFLPS